MILTMMMIATMIIMKIAVQKSEYSILDQQINSSNCLSEFNHFVGLSLKGLNYEIEGKVSNEFQNSLYLMG